MNLEQLSSYTGNLPAPEDFDAFWQKAVKDLANTDTDVSITPAHFQVPGAECFDVYFTGIGGAKVYAKYVRPIAKEPVPAVLLFHGYTISSPDWADLLMYPCAGMAVFALDCRGQGGKSQDVGGVLGNTHMGHLIRGATQGPEHLLYRAIYLDSLRLSQIAQSLPEVDKNKLYATGGSQGGGLAVACAGLNQSIKKLSILFPFLSDIKAQYQAHGQAFAEIRQYFRSFDPTHERADELFHCLSYIDVKNFAPSIHADTLMMSGAEDQMVPLAGQYALFNTLCGKKRHILYPEYGHEALLGANSRTLQFFLDSE